MRRGGALPRESAKAKAQRVERDAVRRTVLAAADWTCQARTVWPEVECHGSLDVHERVQRSLRPGGHLDVDNCLALCSAHHHAAHSNIALAHERGLLRHSWEG
jgi:predicted restriction endonuclease